MKNRHVALWGLAFLFGAAIALALLTGAAALPNIIRNQYTTNTPGNTVAGTVIFNQVVIGSNAPTTDAPLEIITPAPTNEAIRLRSPGVAGGYSLSGGGTISQGLLTNNTYSDLTNHVVDFDAGYSDLFATNDVNFVHSTNRAVGVWKNSVIKVYGGAADRQVWLHPSWTPIGAFTTNLILYAGKTGILSATQDGDSETNVCVVWSPQP